MKKERNATKEELEKKVDFVKVEKKEEKGFDFMKMLNDPKIASLLEGGKDLFKKKETDPNMCEIHIKAPSEVVLKLFNIKK